MKAALVIGFLADQSLSFSSLNSNVAGPIPGRSYAPWSMGAGAGSASAPSHTAEDNVTASLILQKQVRGGLNSAFYLVPSTCGH